MIKECDNKDYYKWIEMAEPIFISMGIDLFKIPITISKKMNDFLPNDTGRTIPDYYYTQIYSPYRKIYYQPEAIMRNDMDFELFIQTYAHEIGHIIYWLGFFKTNYQPGTFMDNINEAVALRFEKIFLIMFNRKYGTKIIIDTYKPKYKLFGYMPLIMKSEYRLP